MSDYPGTRVVITSDETLLEVARQVQEKTDARDINRTVQSMRSYVLEHGDDIKATTLDDVTETVNTMLLNSKIEGISKCLRYLLKALHSCTFRT